MLKRLPAIRTSVLLGSILLLAIVLRAGFFVGLVSGDPQDDGIYYGNAFALFTDGPRYLGQFRNLPADFLANPIDQFHVRPMVTYPIAASFALFGPGELAAALWALACSTLTVVVLYRLGAVVHGRTAGLVAALLCAFYPLEVINATRILSDVQVGLFSSVGLLLFIEASRRRSEVFYALSGAAAAGAYLANARGLLFLIALLGCGTLLALRGRADWRAPVWILSGFLAIFSVEALIYYRSTGDPLLSYHIQSGASQFKYLHEGFASVRWGWLDVRYTNGTPLELSRSVLLLIGGPTNQFGFFFYLFLASALFSLVRRRNLLLLALATGLFLYLEFGPLRVSVDWPHRELHYMMLFKQQRFLLMLTAPFVVMAAYLLCAIGRTSQIAAVLLVLILFVTSVAAIARTRDHYRDGLSELRAVADDVRANPGRVFSGDLWAVLHLRIFTRYQAQNLRVLDTNTSLDALRNGCVILGGSRGVELLADYVESTLPVFARDALRTGIAPPGWRLEREVPGERNPQRARNLMVYCVP